MCSVESVVASLSDGALLNCRIAWMETDMHTHPLPKLRFRPSLSCVLLLTLLAVLWFAGGASRADAVGQVMVRSAAWILVIVGILFGKRPSFGDVKPVLFLLLAALLLVVAQLLPLPPGAWQALPGRDVLSETAVVTAQDQPWRPLSIVPGATYNAASSLIVPFATLFFAVGLRQSERLWLPVVILILIAASTVVGLLQFSGAGFNNPSINDLMGEVSGSFANRNHFALFLAFGCVFAPVWAFRSGHRSFWRVPVALGLVLLFALTILATGSRAGVLLGCLALIIGVFLVHQRIRKFLRNAPKWTFPALIAALLGVVAISVLLSVAADRAASIDRILALDTEHDLRSRALPTVLAMINTYFPAGSGLGGFDPVFRMHEPTPLLNISYFNHAHNDFLEIALDAGLPGIVLLLGAIFWWLFASIGAWRDRTDGDVTLARLGAATLLLIFIASAFDYPARTPMMMAIIVLAGTWLSWRKSGSSRSALPVDDQHL